MNFTILTIFKNVLHHPVVKLWLSNDNFPIILFKQLMAMIILSVCVSLTILGISYKWNHRVSVLLHLSLSMMSLRFRHVVD